MKKLLLLLCVCGCFAVTPLFAQNDYYAVDLTNTNSGGQLANGPYTVGWSFVVTSPVFVTDLAVFNPGGAALLESHTVGIWNSAGTLVDSAVIPAGNVATLESNDFFANPQTWRDVYAPAFLPAGTYTIGATWNNFLDPMIFDGMLAPGDMHVDSPIVFLQNEYIDGGFAEPINTTGDTRSYFGPNFEMTPEPGTLIMLGTGVLGLAGVLRRKINL